jgi:hypothetical protein
VAVGPFLGRCDYALELVWTCFCCAARHSFHLSGMIEQQTEASGSH